MSDEDALQLRAYRELLFARPELELVNGAVVAQVRLDARIRPDANGNPVPPRSRTSAAPMAAGNARGSRFFSRDERCRACRYALDR